MMMDTAVYIFCNVLCDFYFVKIHVEIINVDIVM